MIIKEQLSSVHNKHIYSTSRDQSTFSKYSEDSFEISQKNSNGLSTFDILQEGHRAARVAEVDRCMLHTRTQCKKIINAKGWYIHG